MGVKFSGKYQSAVACEVTHESGAIIHTMAPKDNGGDGSLFSPTDTLVAAFGTCATTTMGLFAQRNSIALTGVEFTLEKIMTTTLPRRVACIKGAFRLTFDNSKGVDQSQKHQVIEAGRTCPVALSLSENIKIECDFNIN